MVSEKVKERRIRIGYVRGGKKYPVFAWARSDGRCGYDIGRGGDMGCGIGDGDMDKAKEWAQKAADDLQRKLDERWKCIAADLKL